ncbi:hypothetical protein CIT292_07358 [Citrobacter youngae ATCC 29220]|uniref:Uncharacterized protein n=1 Tax=Citrobacter youngae ATCC 29220 TaxID=500640 RepID=D4BA66_9ENTR|nr:hypothetical protein CIT292_07358 [Citrobacter youngae ATCC 29220]
MRDPAVRIVDIADDARAADAGLHAGRKQARFQAVDAKGAFVGGLRFVVDKSRIVRTGLHAVGATHAAGVVDHHNTVFALEGSLHRTNGYARGIITMVAQTRQQDVGDAVLACNLHLILVDQGSEFSLRRLVFNGATDGTGLAADTASQIDQHGVAMLK